MKPQQIKFIKDKADILQVVQSLIPLNDKGQGKCPFHTEKSGSLAVNSKKQIFKCFGCGASGDVVDFVSRFKKIDTDAACNFIADFYRIGDFKDLSKDYTPEPVKELPASYIGGSLMYACMGESRINNFSTWLRSIFGDMKAAKALLKYNVGTSKHWPGATVFWQIDNEVRIRSGKIMLYNPETGKRVKEPFNHINWVHKVLELQNFNLKQCFFGEHLLKVHNRDRKICIVESEKTAIVASIYYPDQIWLASGSLVNLTVEKCQVLKGRDVILFPDVGAFDKWQDKAVLLGLIYPDTHFTIDQTLANETRKGFDLCDYIIENLNQLNHAQ